MRKLLTTLLPTLNSLKQSNLDKKILTTILLLLTTRYYQRIRVFYIVTLIWCKFLLYCYSLYIRIHDTNQNYMYDNCVHCTCVEVVRCLVRSVLCAVLCCLVLCAAYMFVFVSVHVHVFAGVLLIMCVSCICVLCAYVCAYV